MLLQNLGTTDVGDSEIQGVKEELLALAGVETFGEDDLPNEQQIEVLEQYLSAVEQLDGQVGINWAIRGGVAASLRLWKDWAWG